MKDMTDVKNGSSIFKKILIPMSILIFIEAVLLLSVIFGGNVFTYLNQNSKDIMSEKVNNRKTYLEGQMINKWSQVATAANIINQKTAELMKDGTISMATLDDSSTESTPLFLEISEDLIKLMRNNRVSGAFVIINNEDLRETASIGDYPNKPCLYFRDLDPASRASANNRDLRIECAPSAIVQDLSIPMDAIWTPQFEFDKSIGYDSFFYETFQNAYEYGYQSSNLLDFGYWSEPHNSRGDKKQIISYTVPLILDDGTVYGVMGVDITLDYLRKMIPYSELDENMNGSYILGIQNQDDLIFDKVLVNGAIYAQAARDSKRVELQYKDVSRQDLIITDTDFYCTVEYLDLYNSNTRFASQKWALIGVVREQDLFAFSNRIRTVLLTAILLTLIVGVLGSFLVSTFVSRKVTALSNDIETVRTKEAVALTRTGITEIDRLAVSIENLNRDVIESATKFTQIMEMASVKIGGFEIKIPDNSIFITDGFFEIFHQKTIDTSKITVAEFMNIIKDLNPYIQIKNKEEGFTLYKMPTSGGDVYVKLKYSEIDGRGVGLAEDVTQTIIEKNKIEHERDYDFLTGLLNRRAFYEILKQRFDEPKTLKIAALIMLDLDNLKHLNDTYGHDCGDKYIQNAAECFVESTPSQGIISRISGDEFYIFLYGYDSKDELREELSRFRKALNERIFILPDQDTYHVRVSGGVAWYPDDSTSYEELLKYSDFAMYKVKQTVKGELCDFDLNLYNREAYLVQNKAELTQLIEKELIEYSFQPIISAQTGEIFAYEALMRANLPTLRNPEEILALAKIESKLKQIETLSLFKAMEAYATHVESGQIDSKCKIFVNSIANQVMSFGRIKQFESRFGKYLHNIVLEMTEEEQIEQSSLNIKTNMLLEWGASCALDDYGSGYNSQKNLLILAPEFIKIDIEIIRGIDTNIDKQKIVENVISYAHERDMMVIAEGIETERETEMVIRMGVDYLQGYFLPKPALIPPILSDETKKQILNMKNNALEDEVSNESA